MMSPFLNVSKYLIKNADSLAIEIVEGVLNKMNLNIPDWEKEQAIIMYIEFLGFLGESLTDNKAGVPEDLLTWSKKNGEREASSGGRISEIVIRYSPTRNVFTELLTNISLSFGLSVTENSLIIQRVNDMLDLSLNETIFAFERLTNLIMTETQKEMAELSAPVVPLKDGIAVLPLIGTIDSYRATYILESVVPIISDLQLNHLIVDFSGILIIDIEIARYLYQIENVLRLLGINTIVTGLRPQLAQTVVQGGIDLSTVNTYSTVKQALKTIN